MPKYQNIESEKTWLTQPLSWTEWLAMLFHLSYLHVNKPFSRRQSDLLKAYIVLPDSLKWCRSFPMPLEGRSRLISLLKCPSVQISSGLFPWLCSRRLAHQSRLVPPPTGPFAPALLSSALKAIPCSVASSISIQYILQISFQIHFLRKMYNLQIYMHSVINFLGAK